MTQAGMTPKTVIVAAGAADVRDRFATALEGAGHRAIGVGHLPELLEALRSASDRVDLVVLDLGLQDEAVDTIRAIKTLDPKVPIVILSGSVRSAAEVRTLDDSGVDRYVNEHIAVQHILPSLAPQLFPDSFNRRTSVRVTLGIPVTLRFGESITAALTLNLGKGGLGVRTINPLDSGTKVAVRFRLPGSQQDVDAASRVVWYDRRSGMGLQFERVATHDQSAIDEFVDQHFFPSVPSA